MRRDPHSDATPQARGVSADGSNTTADHSATHELAELSAQLGVSVESLATIGYRRVRDEWHNAERDAGGEVIGASRRLPDGSKKAAAGRKRGLAMPWPLPPYAGTSRDDPILVVEGGSDAAAGLDLGFCTIGRPSATGGAALLCTLLGSLHVVIVGENDSGAGRKGAESIGAALSSIAASVRVIYPPAGVKDLRQWLRSLGAEAARAAVLEAITAASPMLPPEPERPNFLPGSVPILRRASDVKPEQIEWLWAGHVPIGKLTVLAGDPGVGKSFLTIDIIARASGGWGWPGESAEPIIRRGIVLYNAEDGAGDTLRPRLEAAEADLDRVNIMEGVRRADGREAGFTLDDLDALEAAINETPECGLVVIDPLGACFGRADTHREAEVRGVLAPLARLAERRRVAIVLVCHLNKSQGRKALHRLTGSLAVAAAARIVWLVHREHPEAARRLLLPVKANIVRDPTGLAFTLTGDPPRLVWEREPVRMTADEAMAAEADSDARSELEEAIEFLREELACGSVAVQTIETRAKAASIAFGTLKRAKKRLGVISTKTGMDGGWEWSLPKAAQAA